MADTENVRKQRKDCSISVNVKTRANHIDVTTCGLEPNGFALVEGGVS